MLLEVQAQDMLRRPMSQVEPLNVCDLVALAELPDVPRSFAPALQLFVNRASREIADIPNGKAWLEFLEEYAQLEGYQVPETFRGWMVREKDKGEIRNAERIHDVLTQWSEDQPEAFELAEGETEVVTVSHPPPSDRPTRERAPAAPRQPKVVTSEEAERRQWIVELVLDRVASAPESGLGEHVLVAGVRHRAKEKYPTLVPADVTSVLRELKDTGRIRYSAGRWAAIRRY